MADPTQTVKVVSDGKLAEVDYPAAYTPAQIDQHLKDNGAHRYQDYDPSQPWVSPINPYNYFKNMSTVEKALTVASFAVGGPEVMAGVRLGGAVAKGAGFGARAASAGLQLTKGAVAGGTGAAVGQQFGEEGAPSVAGGATTGAFITSLGLAGQGLINGISKMLMGHITQSFLDGSALKNFLTDFMPKVFSQKDSTSGVFNSVLEGKIAVTAEQEIQAATKLATRGAQKAGVVVPNVTKSLKDLGFDMKGDYAGVDWARGYMPIDAAVAAYRDLTPFVSKEGSALAGKSAALMRNVRDYLDAEIQSALGPRSAAIWNAGRTRYGQLQRINEFLTGGDAKVFKPNGTPDFEYLKEKFLKDFTGDKGVRELMGQTYDNLRDTIFRQGSVLVRDVPGYMPFTRGWVTRHGPGATLGVPFPAKLSGAPGEIPATVGAQAAALLSPAAMGGIPSGVGP